MLPAIDKFQREFCEADVTDIRLLAPAGCGKTMSLLFRCLKLAERASPQKIRFLLVTFTVAAKQEIISRLSEDERFKGLRDHVEVTTLNSWGFRRIKNVAFSATLLSGKDKYHFAMLNQLQPIWKDYPHVRRAIEQKKNTTPRKLMDLMDSFKSVGFDHRRHTTRDQFLKRLGELRKQGLESKIDALIDTLAQLDVLTTTIDRAGHELTTAADAELFSHFYQFWIAATEHMIQSATFTLEDQKYVAYLDEKQKLEEGKVLSGAARYDHVLVDEFQDINPLDLALIKAIKERNRASLTIVGDDDQAIFEWRGATPEYILNPGRYFGTAFQTFTLGINYRSPKNIVERSQCLIANNTRRVDKSTRAACTDDALISVEKTEDLGVAMELVLGEVERTIGTGGSPSRVAIIGRKRSQLIPYQVFFASKNIPFCAAEDLQVFMSDAFDRLLRLILMKSQATDRRVRTQIVDDVLELCNLVKRYPLSKADKESLRQHLNKCGKSTLVDAIIFLKKYRGTLKKTPNSDGAININMAEAIEHFLAAETVAESLSALGSHFEGLQMDIGKAEDDIFFADPPFLHLAEYAVRYDDDYMQFVEDIERAKDQLVYVPPYDDDGESASKDDLWKRPLHLMTALRAKGKEFDSVVLLDVNDGIWPSKKAKTSEEKEAERRVFYVAFTRAKKRILMQVSKRFGFRDAVPSAYISELGITSASKKAKT